MKVGIISPRVLIRRALSTLLVTTGSAYVVLERGSIFENLEEIKQSHVDTLIVDVCGPWDVEGLSELTRLEKVKVLILMDDLHRDACARALRLGAWGCLSTKESPSAFQNTLKAVARGERWIPQRATHQITRGLLEKKAPIRKAAEGLTPREWEVLGHLANGFRNKEISDQLSISEETVKSHIKSIYRKLKIKGRRSAILRYFEQIHHSADQEGIDQSGAGHRVLVSSGKS